MYTTIAKFVLPNSEFQIERFFTISLTQFSISYSHIADMYGMKGGSKVNGVYPTAKNVREEFYKAYPGEPFLTFDPTKGDIPIVRLGKFRWLICELGKILTSYVFYVATFSQTFKLSKIQAVEY